MQKHEIEFPVLIMVDRHSHAEILAAGLHQLLGYPRDDLFKVTKLPKDQKWGNAPEHGSLIKLGAHNECQYLVEVLY